MSTKTSGLAAVARLAGVSTATVSNTLNRPHVVARETRDRVLAAIEKLDFVPSSAAAALRQGTSRMIGLVVPDITNPFYAAIARGVVDAADRARHSVSLCVSYDDPERELRQFTLLAEQRAAGALVVPLSADPTRLAKLRSVGAHLVLVDRAARADEGCSVIIDDVEGGRLAMQHLLSTRGPRAAIVNGPRGIPQCDDRRAGARRAFRDAGLNPNDLREVEVAAMTIAQGVAAGRRIAADAVSGIFCANDQLATGVIRGLALEGVRSPSDISIVGYGDLPLAIDGALPLTTVEQPKDLLGRAAVEKLLGEVGESPASHEHSTTMLAPTLVVRESAPA